MEHEIAEYNEDRNRQIAILLEKQRCELLEIDNEIMKLGINVADITEAMQDIHFFAANAAVHLSPHERQILSRNSHYNNNRDSVISLQHSHSSSSFISNTTNANGTTTYK